ncbi:MAG: hypothetical protein J5725_04325 [Bacteroidales bacterium]|nr:hypothetical protein [Bacteroidales bacterium]
MAVIYGSKAVIVVKEENSDKEYEIKSVNGQYVEDYAKITITIKEGIRDDM